MRPKFWCPKVFGVPRNLGEKFGSKVLSPKKFGSQKILVPKKILGKKILG